MFCSACGHAIEAGQGVCPQCGRPVAAPIPPVPGLEFQRQNYASRIRALGVVWYIYAGLVLVAGFIGITFVRAFLEGYWGPWMHGPWGHGPLPPYFFGPALVHLVWVFLFARVALAVAAGWGLMEHAPWGRIVAIVAAFLSILKFPFGTVLGIWTLVVLMGYRNASLYDQL